MIKLMIQMVLNYSDLNPAVRSEAMKATQLLAHMTMQFASP